MIVASRTAETLRAQLDEHPLFQNRQMPQADRITVAVKIKGLPPAARTDRIGTSTFDRNNDLSLFQFGLQNADLGKVQRKLDHWRHKSKPFKRNFVRLQPATTLTALQDHNILGHFRQFPESRYFPNVSLSDVKRIRLLPYRCASFFKYHACFQALSYGTGLNPSSPKAHVEMDVKS